MGPGAETGAELLKQMGIEAYSTIYKFVLIILVILCTFIYQKYKVSEQLEEHFSFFTLTWMSLGMTITSIFWFVGANTDIFFETFFACLGAFMNSYYLYSQYEIANKKGMNAQRWLQSLFLGIVDVFLIVKISKEIALFILLIQTMFFVIYESKNKKNNLESK